VYVRTIQRHTKDGGAVRYLQLAHNQWDAKAGYSKVQVLYNFGREDEVDRDAIKRLIGSLTRFLPPEDALAVNAAPDLRFLESKPLGGAYVLDQVWRQLGLHDKLAELLRGRRLDPRAERVLFAMVAGRALEPLSKLACATWVQERVAIPGLSELDEDTCYRAMDWLLEVEAPLSEAVYWATADLLNLEVDLLFFDTTSTYFETDQADPAIPAEGEPEAKRSFRTYGKSKDHRPDLPQVVIGLAVTRDGIPIRVWTWPGNTNDSALIRQVKDDLREWKLSRVVWVADRGFSSAENRRYLQRAGGHYIIGEKIRDDSAEPQAALSRQGRYHTVAGNLQIKEMVLDDGTMRDRFVICRNPDVAARDKAVRGQLLEQLRATIADTDRLPAEKRAELVGSLKAKPGLSRFLRVTGRGLLRVDMAQVAAQERIDGKFLLRTSDPTLSAEDVALGYKQLLQVERAWRDMKTTLDLRPVYHRKEERIRAHIILCWLALLLIRIIENQSGDTWRNLCNKLQRMHVGTFSGPAGTVLQRTETTAPQRAILSALQLKEPPRFLHLQAPTSRKTA